MIFCPLSPAEVIAVLNELILDKAKTEHYFTLPLVDVNLVAGKWSGPNSGIHFKRCSEQMAKLSKKVTVVFQSGCPPMLPLDSIK